MKPIEPPTRRDMARLGASFAASAAALRGGSKNPAIVKAMQSVTAAIPKAEADPARPLYHFRPPANWNNDPNGTIFYKGWHHLFYQHNPYGAAWGHMHWGHARSRDLVNWEHLPIALWPSLEQGEEHVFSGGAILAADGRPRLFYTSIGKRDPEQWLALPADDDLIVWEKHPRNPILTLAAHGGRKVADWRDPFLFREGGKTWMVCGGNSGDRMRGGGGEVQLYEAVTGDLSRWKHRGTVFRDRNRENVNVECPNLFKLGTKWVLLTSPHKPCEYFVGDLDLGRARFVPDAHGVLDPGASYASNISYDDKGRCILWLWAKTGNKPEMGWQNAMAIPRLLSLDSDGFLRQVPVPEIETLRGERLTAPPAVIEDKAIPLGGVAGDCLEIQAEFSGRGAAAMGLRVRSKPGGAGTDISYDPRSGMLTAGREKKLVGRSQPFRLRVFLDRRLMEVYVNGGEAAILTPIDAPPGDVAVQAFVKGGKAKLESLEAWKMKPARFSLEHFKA